MADYIELEYIKSTGTQYIDTDFILKSTSDVEFEFAYLNGSWNNNWIPLAGVRNTQESTDNPCYTFFINSSTLKLSSEYAGYDAGSESSLPIINVNQKYKFSCINKKYFVNDDETHYSYTSNNLQDSKMIYSAYIFCMNKVGIADLRNLSMKLYSFKIWDNDVLVRDFIPVKRKSDNEVCLYDNVSNTFFTNQGTGNFIAGPEITEPTIKDNIYLIGNKIVNLINLSDEILYGYKELEYIESTGAQYIDTKFKPNNNTKVAIDAYYTPDSSVSIIFGSEYYISSTDSDINTLYIGKASRYSYNYFTSYDTNVTYYNCNSSFYDKRHLYKINKNNSYIDDILVGSFTNHSFQTIYDAYLFASNFNGNVDFKAKMRLYTCKIWDNDNLIRDFIPVKRITDNVICLYDKVTKQYFTNQGTGTFKGGLPKNPTTQDILDNALYHYESTNLKTSWELDTGVPQSSLGVSTMLFKIKPTAWSRYYGLFGKHSGTSGMTLQCDDVAGGLFLYYGGGTETKIPLEYLPVNNTHILIVQRDSNKLTKAFVNNQLVGSLENSTFSPMGNIVIGRSYNDYNRYYHGYMYQYYVWDRVFTEQQVADLYNYFKD